MRKALASSVPGLIQAALKKVSLTLGMPKTLDDKESPLAMDAVPLERFAPEFSIPDYSPVDAHSFCLASQLAYSKLPDGAIDEATIRQQRRSEKSSVGTCKPITRYG